MACLYDKMRKKNYYFGKFFHINELIYEDPNKEHEELRLSLEYKETVLE